MYRVLTLKHWRNNTTVQLAFYTTRGYYFTVQITTEQHKYKTLDNLSSGTQIGHKHGGSLFGGDVFGTHEWWNWTEMHVIWETEELVAFLHPRPWTPGSTVVTQKTTGGPSSLFQLPERDFLSLLLGARVVGALLRKRLGVRRCALHISSKI